MSVTQGTLSQLLGVRRTTVTQMVAKLRAVGAVRSDRRGLIEIDRARLEEASCECYRIMRRETDRIVPDEAVTPRLHFSLAAALTADDRFELRGLWFARLGASASSAAIDIALSAAVTRRLEAGAVVPMSILRHASTSRRSDEKLTSGEDCLARKSPGLPRGNQS